MIFICTLLLSTSFFASESFANCPDCASEAYAGYKDAKKAYKSSELSGCKRYAKKAYRHASSAEDEANSCN